MSTLKIVTFILALLISIQITSKAQTVSEPSTTELISGEATDYESVISADDTSKSKKTTKKKDKIELDSTFYYSLLVNLGAVLVLIMLFHFRNYNRQDIFFTYFIFNITIFLLTFLLNEIKISMGAAFGLFAVFSMLRYRTEGISMKDMTYLFIVIAMGLMAAIQLEIKELIIIDSIILMATFLLEGQIIFKPVSSKKIRYDNIELIKANKQEELLADLENRTGLKITRLEIKGINFLRDTASIVIYYKNSKK